MRLKEPTNANVVLCRDQRRLQKSFWGGQLNTLIAILNQSFVRLVYPPNQVVMFIQLDKSCGGREATSASAAKKLFDSNNECLLRNKRHSPRFRAKKLGEWSLLHVGSYKVYNMQITRDGHCTYFRVVSSFHVHFISSEKKRINAKLGQQLQRDFNWGGEKVHMGN